MEHDFAGRVALVTGAGSGIGAACARMLAEAGGAVVVTDIDEVAAKGVAAAIAADGGRARAVRVDVTDPASLEAAVAVAIAEFGQLDLGVNNAGVSSRRAATADLPVDAWRRIVDTNLSGIFYSMRAELPAMLAAGGGAIVNMASVLGTVGLAESAAYVAAKHGVVGLTKVAALDYAARGIRVNAVAPGFIDTPMMVDEKGRLPRGLAFMMPNQRVGTVDEVAEVVLFLLSERASLVTGSCHLADGGYSAR